MELLEKGMRERGGNILLFLHLFPSYCFQDWPFAPRFKLRLGSSAFSFLLATGSQEAQDTSLNQIPKRVQLRWLCFACFGCVWARTVLLKYTEFGLQTKKDLGKPRFVKWEIWSYKGMCWIPISRQGCCWSAGKAAQPELSLGVMKCLSSGDLSRQVIGPRDTPDCRTRCLSLVVLPDWD